MKACLDACVLYPTVLREILIGVARAGLITPLWSARILEEWARAAARRNPGDEVIARGEIAALRAAWPGAETAANPALEAQLWLPDTGDLHVLATAISGGAEAIITLNLKDFPARELNAHNLRAEHPDAVLRRLWAAHPDPVAQVVHKVHHRAETLSGGPLDLRRLMKRARLPRLGKALAD
ncbi:PIN domain-containing protein [Rhodophyticola sp. CCM32]|uniref:RSP_2648 family PIN domain-containing protein n=1 Tax=Rhodophyticola sp. CCM32 TaxID=2916397 RepID=UPI00107FC7DC|nr:PIN domain-containing protein [Rhodophyticola sp. CCM32]QBX99718.1 PIN domain-containing protein [Rhodophyticola sp. CCM32]